MNLRYLVLSLVLMLCGLALLAPVAGAQVTNPTTVTWDHADYATAVSYELAYFALPVKADHSCDWAGTPALAAAVTNTLAKPTTTTGLGMSAALPSRPVGCYVAKMRALDASGLFSDYSDATVPFGLLPVKPGKPVLK